MQKTCPDNFPQRPTVLIVDDSKTFASLLQRRIRNELHLDTKVAMSYQETANVIASAKQEFLLALLDLNLPDAPNGEIVDLVLSKRIPSIIFTAEINDDLRDLFWSKRIIDYVLKQNIGNIDYILNTIKRVHDNKDMKILVVDDSTLARNHIAALLAAHCYQPHLAANAAEAMAILENVPDIKLVIIDFTMPDMDGASLTKAIRAKFGKKDMAIIGVSSHGGAGTSVSFLKNGANDYITKPFLTEEFYCRISQNIDILNQFETINDLVNRDFLTQLHNRKYLIETGEKFFANLKRKNIDMVVALIDIDDFKKINDTYGHDVGDDALQHIAGVIRARFRETDIVARYGGEEFCVVNINMEKEKAYEVYNELRECIRDEPFVSEGRPITLSVSIGICSRHMHTFAEMVRMADKLMYEAKGSGKDNILVF